LVGHLDLLMRLLVLGGEGDDSPQRISRSEVAVLDTLGAEGAMTMGELAARVRVPLSTATRIVDRMVERDLIQRERPEDNRRVVRVALAGAGRRFYDDALAARVAGTERMLHYLTADERHELLRLYRKMSQGLQADVGREDGR
jgi:DNA-binding MarR family transcriptional regulator